jgi:pilus assembly protein CpaF
MCGYPDGDNTNKKKEVRKMQVKKREGPIDLVFEAMPDGALFSKIKDDLLYSRTGIKLEDYLSGENSDRFLKEMDEYIRRIYRISEDKIKRFNEYILNYVFGFHVLTSLIEDDEISDIKVMSWDNIRIKRHGKRMGTGITFWSPEDFRGTVEMIAVKNGINLGSTNAIPTFVDKKSSKKARLRFNISGETINDSGEPSIHIRKILTTKKTISKLMQEGLLTRKIADYLIRKHGDGYMIVCGKNASGKTSLVNALLDEIPQTESVLVVQENEELFSDVHKDMLFQHIDKKNKFGLKELVINAQMLDVDHIVIGEIKGVEALYFVTAALTGCTGMATIHSENAERALDKLADYCKWGSDYSREELFKLLSCVKTIVYLDDYKITEIVTNHGWDEMAGCNYFETVYDKERGVDLL